MPNRWFHEALDIAVWGKSYWSLHRRKDAAYRTLGPKHRAVGHGWYSRLNQDWTFDNPFPEMVLARTRQIRTSHGPDAAEKYQAAVTHDYFDALWDTFRRADRARVAECVRQLILDPNVLREWVGVDVMRGLVKRSRGLEHGLLFPVDAWEREPGLPRAYQHLRAYITNSPLTTLSDRFRESHPALARARLTISSRSVCRDGHFVRATLGGRAAKSSAPSVTFL